ncbi:hypothetical protein K492DRAFT_146901 [Lichtheimia hyalospora FSU 10163]|nr:hypothetical protein K492DRAFT_146901 [Lichtheimia hyalospora FSU 10163]
MNRDDENEFIDIDDEDNIPNEPSTIPTDQTHTNISSESIDPPLHFHNDMDDRSRELIEQMLAEEQYYYGNDTLATMSSPTKRKKQPSKKPKPEARSSASLPSHKTRWAADEDERLRKAIVTHGHGNWKAIANDVKTRNPLQCKNRARHWIASDNKASKVESTKSQDTTISESVIEHPPPSNDTTSRSETTPSAPLNMDNVDMDEDDEDISITEGSDNDQEVPDIHFTEEQQDDVQAKEEDINTMEEKDLIAETTEERDSSAEKEQVISSETHDNSIKDHTTTLKEEEDPHPIATATIPHDLYEEKDHDIKMENGERVDQLEEDSETQFDRYVIGDDEKANNPEWFKNKASKTPDRYLKIRNHLLDGWKACRPRYLTKTSARKGLKDCGDVNAIGRVHEYLESVGAINVGCINNAPRPPKRIAQKTYDDEETDMFAAADLVIGYEGPRKRKVRNELGEWVDPKELEGRVIEHGKPKDLSRPKRIIKRPKHYNSDEFGRGYDPFRLVPVDYYSDEDPAPFKVEITSDALLVMDFHSHLAHTEIIGLLGGNYDVRDGIKLLKVQSVFPCRSTSTGIQCEMDPESEMRAREVFAEQGYGVVGWYHSHPTFEPQPSIRDIENQTSYQTLFRHQDTGDEPFIGVIVTPYDPDIVSDHSIIQYLHISSRWNETKQFRLPYACRRTVIQTDQISSNVMKEFEHLMEEFKDYEHKVDMHEIFHESRTRLDKLLDSLRSNMFLPSEDVSQYLDQVRHLVTRYDPPIEKDQSSQQDNNDNSPTPMNTTNPPEVDTTTTSNSTTICTQ